MELTTGSGRRLGIGIQTPIVIQTPGGHARWEETAGIDDLGRIAQAADRLGYGHMTCSEHVAIPERESRRRGDVYWEPLATLSWIAAQTERIRLATNVVVLGYHHPVEILKGYGTLDRLSGGRVVLGVGVGSLQEEFEMIGAPFEDRGSMADDALAAIRAGWGHRVVQHHGPHFRFGPVAVEPHAPRTDVAVWVGGRTRRSLRRAAELGTGWTPFGLRLPEVAAMLGSVELPDGFEVVLGPERPLDPQGAPGATLASLDTLAASGVTSVHAAFVHHSPADYLEQLEALAELANARR